MSTSVRPSSSYSPSASHNSPPHQYPHPFDILYNDTNNRKFPSTHWHSHSNYQRIANNIHDKSPSPDVHIPPKSLHPILTNSNISRNHSISSSKTLRNRKNKHHQQQSRNYTYEFPVRRKRSLKYESAKVSNFKSKLQFKQFLKLSNYESIVKSIIPRTMKVYEYKNTLNPIPKLMYSTIETENTNVKRSHGYKLSDINFMDLILQKYKHACFSYKYMIPPKFQQLYPQDAKLLNKYELNNLNTKMLFDILLRRTLAAKIEYRLRIRNQEIKSEESESDSDESRYSSSDSDLSTTHHRPNLSNHSLSSEEFIKHDSIFKDLLIPEEKPPPPPPHFKNEFINDFKNEFVNDFNKTYVQTNQHQNLYLLEPHHRSQITISSSSSEKNSSSVKRKSQSTTNTSIFHNLDTISDDLNSFIEEIDNKKYQSHNLIPKEITQPNELIDNLNRQIKFNTRFTEVQINQRASLKSNKASIKTSSTDYISPSLNSVSRFKSYKRNSMIA